MKFLVTSASGSLTDYNLPHIDEIDTSRKRLDWGDMTVADINTLEELIEFLEATHEDDDGIIIERFRGNKEKFPSDYEITIYDYYIE